jgi:Uma2 family endonuclease
MVAGMGTTVALPEERVVMHNISWETYQRLLSESINSCGTRMAYDEGTLEVMVVYAGHEDLNRTLAAIAEITAVVTGRDFRRTGSTTFQREDLLKGFEPDSSFYFKNAAAVRGKSQLDLRHDPPPELVIEVDITRSCLRRFPIFAGIGVAEVWRYDGQRVRFYALAGREYQQIEQSIVLSPMTAGQATSLLELNAAETAPAWDETVRKWVIAQL